MFKLPPQTKGRLRLAIIVAVVADALQVGIQLLIGPASWIGIVQAIDVVAMIITMALLGFHPLLLPTFVIEFLPIVDMAPTWTGCVIAVIALRKAGASISSAPPANSEPPQIKDAGQNPPPQS